MHDRENNFRSAELSTPEQWEQLNGSNVFFGHQSVGADICQSLEQLIASHPSLTIKITESTSAEDLHGGVIAHHTIGKNFSPSSKNGEFAEIVNSGIGKKADIVFFKYCYVDVTAETEVESLFSTYRKEMTRLKLKFPSLVIVHVTVPLTVVQTGFRAWVKKGIGREIRGHSNNIARNTFNNIMRSVYSGKEPIFDLARLESTGKNGKRNVFFNGKNSYEALCPEYARDGRHLNKNASAVVAQELLFFLARLATPGAEEVHESCLTVGNS